MKGFLSAIADFLIEGVQEYDDPTFGQRLRDTVEIGSRIIAVVAAGALAGLAFGQFAGAIAAYVSDDPRIFHTVVQHSAGAGVVLAILAVCTWKP